MMCRIHTSNISDDDDDDYDDGVMIRDDTRPKSCFTFVMSVAAGISYNW
jgi:hypothetical protein